MADGDRVRVELDQQTAVEWNLDAISAGNGERPFEFPSGLDGRRWELARMLSASFDDGLLLALAALRPAGSGGHGEESVAGLLVRRGEPMIVDEALLSVEYDPAGAARRVGVELYEKPDSLPLRMAGDRTGGEGDEAAFGMRSGEASGTGRLVIVRP